MPHADPDAAAAFELESPPRPPDFPALPGPLAGRTGNPYELPDDGRERVINFSGGRSSAYLLHHILQAHGGTLPETARVIFTNTGKEREETLTFIQRCSERMNVEITWLEYDYRAEARGGRADPKNMCRVVDFHSASRAGEPFEALIRSRAFLPNQDKRLCTQELKVNTVKRHLRRDLGISKHIAVLGIRYDEPRRWFKAAVEGCEREYPLVQAGASHADVRRFWASRDWDLEIPSWQGNCDLCFLKGVPNLMETIRGEPERAEWWIRMEDVGAAGAEKRKLIQDSLAFFSARHSYRQLLSEAPQVLPLDPGAEPPEGVDCFCGD